jgi:hypothetical protein
MAAVKVDLTALRYGFNVAAIRKTESRDFVYYFADIFDFTLASLPDSCTSLD